MDDNPEYLAWRAFYLGLRVADQLHQQAGNSSLLSAGLKLLNEIATRESTLQNSSAEVPAPSHVREFAAGNTNLSVVADSELAEFISTGLVRASTGSD